MLECTMKNLTWTTLLLSSQLTGAHSTPSTFLTYNFYSPNIDIAVFSKLYRNYGPVSKVWQYIRKVDDGPAYNGG